MREEKMNRVRET